jgi:LacI family transcriptional regulator, gluconate utilization system Gnt-I transcriptional repressor
MQKEPLLDTLHTPAAEQTATDALPRAGQRPTLIDVAQLAGVSAITVSRALREPERVSPKLRTRIDSAVAQLGYVPDPAARALASGRSPSVVALIPSLSNAVFVEVLEEIHRVLDGAGLQLLIGNTHYRAEEEERLLRSYLPHQPSGLLLAGFERTASAEKLLRDCAVPVVYMMESAPVPGVHSVGIDQRAAGAALTAALLDRGFKRIAFVASQLDRRTMLRAEGYRLTLRARGLWDAQREMLTPEPSSAELGARLLDRTLAHASDTDCVFFCNDDLAIGGIRRAHELGIAVPSRLGIAGFNDLPVAGWTVPALTTVRTPRAAVGKRATEKLLQLIRGEAVVPTPEDLPFELMLRESA